MIKGRQNYLCPRRLERALQQSTELFTTSEQSELQQIADWAQNDERRLDQRPYFEPDAKVWTQVCSEAHICTTKTCGQDRRAAFINKRANV